MLERAGHHLRSGSAHGSMNFALHWLFNKEFSQH